MKNFIIIVLLFCKISVFAQNKFPLIGDSLSFEKIDSMQYRIGLYKLKKKEGCWSYFNSNKLLKIEPYVSDTLNGNLYTFDKNGVLRQILSFKEGRLNGDCFFYSSKGSLLAIYGYIYDKLTYFKYYKITKESPPYDKAFVPKW